MRYGQIRRYDIANGPGIRTSIFVTGCSLNCKNCFNKDYQDPDFGKVRTKETTKTLLSYLDDSQVSGLTILGGEPFENTLDLIDLLEELRNKTSKDIWIYSGYTFEKLSINPTRRKLLSLTDVLVDGPFIESKKDLNLVFRGSCNQRIIDVSKSLATGTAVLLDGYK